MPLAEVLVACSVSALLATSSPRESVQCSDGAMAIPDGQSSASVVLTVEAPPGAIIERVTLSMDVTHEWLGDLTITVSHLDTTVALVDRIASETWSFGCGGADMDAVFTDEAASMPDGLCVPGGPRPMIVGAVRPEQPLSVFNGSDASGDWTITIVDHNPIDVGVLNSVCLTIVTAPGVCSGDVTGDGSIDLADLNLVLANFGEASGEGDADGSGAVDLADLNTVLANFGAGC